MANDLLLKYGAHWNTHDAASIELACIRKGGEWIDGKGNKCGAGLLAHILAFQKIVWPWKAMHKWNEGLIIPELCKPGVVTIFGPASSGKTSECADMALCLYWAFPREITILCSTTTLDALDMRIFGALKHQFKVAKERCPWLPGQVVDSKRVIVTDRSSGDGRDFRNGIKGICNQGGDEFSGLASFIGIKNKHVVLVADEAGLMESSFLDAIANLRNNTRFDAWILGNLSDVTSSLGDAAEPVEGWDSFADSEKSRVYAGRFYDARVIQLIGADSPNFDYPEGSEPFPYLLSRKKLKQAEAYLGKDSDLFSMQYSGRIPRGSIEKRVITKALCEKFNAFDKVTWGEEEITKLYYLDAAYSGVGGDRTVGGAMAFGKDISGEFKLALLRPPKTFKFDRNSTMSNEDQIATQVMIECQEEGIKGSHVFFDGTGRSSLTSAFARVWGEPVVPIEFGGGASMRENFMGRKHVEGPKRGMLLQCNECFGKFVSELWFASRTLIESDQARGLTEDLVREGCMRQWDEVLKGKYDVESKRDTKARLGRSPDIYDAFVCGIEGARRLGFPLGKLEPKQRKKNFGWLTDAIARRKEAAKAKELTYS